MAVNPFTVFVFDIFIFSAILLTAYTFNFYYLAFLAIRRKDKHPVLQLGTPSITIQLPLYNEKYVAARLVDAVCAMDYPKDKMKIMVLDDSDDDTTDLLHNVVADYKKVGFDIVHIRRGTRKGYKTGALKYAMTITNTEYVAIFYADFITRGSSKKQFLHADMDALASAGRRAAKVYRESVLYTTLSPCAMCSGAVVLYGIPHVIAGENRSFMGEETWLRSRGVTVEVVQDAECEALMCEFMQAYPALWNEDIGE